MSTRAMVGGRTDAGIYLVYTHFDGYPDARLPVLDAIITRDGADKALVTILGADAGGWSVLDDRMQDAGRNHLEGRGAIEPGYGLKYTDAPEENPVKWEDFNLGETWAELIYLIEPERNVIRWATIYSVKDKDALAWREFTVGDNLDVYLTQVGES